MDAGRRAVLEGKNLAMAPLILFPLSSDMLQLQSFFRFVMAVWLHDKELAH
jgi:hypothetical protein